MANEIASAYIALYTKMPGVQSDINKSLGGVDASKAGDSVGKSFNAGLTGAIAGATAAIVTKAINMVSDALGSAIARVDTINNFPKIMQNLGYTSEEAADAIQTMSTRLAGLPTALDSMAGMVQQLAPLTGGLSEATELSLALNNALLAGGKSTDIQANAMEQYTQMLAIGKVDMAAWRSMVSAMPGQMDQLAQSILGVDAKSMDLYAALQDGTVGFEDFNNAVLRLNSEGTGEFASFEQQARDSTDGISTGVANMNTAVVRNLASIIAKLKPVIDAFVVGVTDIANAVGPLIIGIIDVAIAVADWAKANRDWLIPAGIFLGIILAVVAAVKLVTAVKLAWAAAMGAAQIATYLSGTSLSIYNGILAVQTAATNVAAGAQRLFNAAMAANPIGIIITLVVALIAALIWFFTQTELGKAIWENLVSFITTVWTGFVEWITAVVNGFAEWWNAVWGAIGNFVSTVWTNIVNWISNAVNNVVSFVTDAVNNISNAWNSVWTGIGNFLKDTWNNILGWIEGGVNGAIDLINGMTGGIRDVLAVVGIEIGEIPHVNIPRLAAGGIVKAQSGGILANIGEGRYDEAVVPLSPAILGQLGGSGQVTQNNTIHMIERDPRLVARQLGRELKAVLA